MMLATSRQEERIMDNNKQSSILGDIDPKPGTQDHMRGGSGSSAFEKPISGAGVDDTTSGNSGTDTGGTRNLRTGSGVVGGDVGNRPE
jgi:hypothetical protein